MKSGHRTTQKANEKKKLLQQKQAKKEDCSCVTPRLLLDRE
jgi:hypothetical protein